MNPKDLEVRRKIAFALPHDALANRPTDALIFIPLLVTAIASTVAILMGLPMWLNFVCALILGNVYAAFFCFGHYLAHGSMVKTKWLREAMLYPCFWMLGMSPHLWKSWHHSMHHTMTNLPGRDPDCFGTLEMQNKRPITGILIPGSGRILPAIVFLLTFFTGHVLTVLFVYSKAKTFLRYTRLNRCRAFVETAIVFASIGVLAFVSGKLAVFTVLLPWLVANAITVSYTMTQHLLCPAPAKQILDSTMSVRLPRWIDRLHLLNSHHVEHHLFPEAPLRTLPVIRKLLEYQFARNFKCPPMGNCLLAVFYTPRFHQEDEHGGCLVDHITGRRVHYFTINSVLFCGRSFHYIKP